MDRATYTEAFQQVCEYINRRIAVWGLPGIAMAVTDREGTLRTEGFGLSNIQTRTPVTDRDLFQIGSIGKTFTALMTMQEVEAGRIDLDEPVKDFLDWFRVKEVSRPISVRDLLVHASGLATGPEAYESGLAEAFTMLEFDPGFPPGQRFHYSNLGYKLMGFILEQVTGRHYPELVSERILEPLEMRSSAGEITQALRSSTVVGYRHAFTDRPAHASHPLVEAAFTPSSTADGCISSTAEDMATFVRALANGGTFSGGQLVSRSSFEEMTRGQNLDPETGDSFGFGIWTTSRYGRPVLEHTGGMVAHRAHMSIDRESGIGLVILGNGARISRIADFARGVLCDVAADLPLRPMPPLDVRVVPQADAYVGEWHAGERSLSLTLEGDYLLAEEDGRQAYAEHREAGVLFLPLPGWELYLLRPVRDLATGRIQCLTHGPDRFLLGTQPDNVPPKPELDPMIGLYRAWNPWLSDLRVFQRDGKLFMQEIDDSDEPGAWETELTPTSGDRVFAVKDGASPEKIAFQQVVDGKAQIAAYMNCPLGRIASD